MISTRAAGDFLITPAALVLRNEIDFLLDFPPHSRCFFLLQWGEGSAVKRKEKNKLLKCLRVLFKKFDPERKADILFTGCKAGLVGQPR